MDLVDSSDDDNTNNTNTSAAGGAAAAISTGSGTGSGGASCGPPAALPARRDGRPRRARSTRRRWGKDEGYE